MLYVPHLKYSFKIKYEEKFLSKDMVGVFTNNHKIRFLFFGNLSYAKGIDIVIDVFTKLSLNLREK